jgi:putative ABC transport system permease protein
LKIESDNLSEAVNAIESKWRSIFPDDPFDYAFMDEKLGALYKSELQMKKAFSIATWVMLFIVLTGVLGIVSLTVSQRTKEIGIRKVLGATVLNIQLMLFKEYAKLILIAFFIIVPLSYYFINQWLGAFAYHIDITWWMFALPALIIFFVTMGIVFIQSLQTALANPSSTLKYE